VKDLGFDVVELSTGFISIPQEDLIELVRAVKDMGLKAKPELGIQFGAGGDTSTSELAAEGFTRLSMKCFIWSECQNIPMC
jgi:phosphosulfolactate synthase (CoM biosynthesis protein A)